MPATLAVAWKSSELHNDTFTSLVDFEHGQHNPAWENWCFGPYRGFNAAGVAYRRDCGWDIPPGNAGTWLVRIVPTGTPGHGVLVGFLVLYDWGPGRERTIGHIWTAPGQRRTGTATTLIQTARTRHAATAVAGPLTEEGRHLLQASAKDLPVA